MSEPLRSYLKVLRKVGTVFSYWQRSIQLCRKPAWALLSFPYHRGTVPAVVTLTRRHGRIELTDSTNSPNWITKPLFKAIFVQLQHRCLYTCLWSQMQIHSKGRVLGSVGRQGMHEDLSSNRQHCMKSWPRLCLLESQCWERAKENAQLPGQPA